MFKKYISLKEENKFRKLGYRLIAGVDEAGRGPLAGPVVAAAVILPCGKPLPQGIRDSKQLTPVERQKIFIWLAHNAFCGIGIVTNEEIDRINILVATLKAMKQAVISLPFSPDLILVDGTKVIPGIEITQKALVKGDTCFPSIASASIVAKVFRDKLMQFYHNIYPNYNFWKNKGYATAKHIEAIKTFGPCPIHRKSFSPVKEYLGWIKRH